MAEKIKSEGSVFRDYRGTEGAIADAVGAPDEHRRGQRGRRGVSSPTSPRPAVRDPGPAHEGSEGEPAYGAPMDMPKPSGGDTKKRKAAKPDPLKPKPKPKDDDDDKDKNDDDDNPGHKGNPY